MIRLVNGGNSHLTQSGKFDKSKPNEPSILKVRGKLKSDFAWTCKVIQTHAN